jgi:hypothetical protein
MMHGQQIVKLIIFVHYVYVLVLFNTYTHTKFKSTMQSALSDHPPLLLSIHKRIYTNENKRAAEGNRQKFL